jgi:hypothetical protein
MPTQPVVLTGLRAEERMRLRSGVLSKGSSPLRAPNFRYHGVLRQSARRLKATLLRRDAEVLPFAYLVLREALPS